MYIKQVELANFRSYNSLKLKLTPGINVFYGINGAGKTNILEAIYCISTGHSFRAAEDSILVRHGREAMMVSVDAVDNGIERNFLLEYDSKARKKSLKVNGTKLSRLSRLVGMVPAVLFSPENIQIVKGEPALRRRLLDDMLSQVDNDYFLTLAKYNKEVAHRNYLLKGIKEGRIRRDSLGVWNTQITQNGIRLLLARFSAVENLNNILQNDLTGDKFSIRLAYTSKNYTVSDEQALRESYTAFFAAKFEEEIARSVTLIGPHRDDIEISYNNMPAKSFSSEGQQRLTTILIKLAEGLLIKSRRGVYPVVLLDDFSSELDEPNSGFIGKTFSLFKQILISTTYKENLRGFSPAKEFIIRDGEAGEMY
ncbi:MAG: DNA replication and repair protein RecF [Spirochaetia bacterium]|nr:DNA replication and repair protein RecF [Spirochaetia bacterium]